MTARTHDVDSTVSSAVEDPDVDDAASFGKKVLREAKVEDIPMLAASLAYRAFVSLIPLLALLFLAAAVVGDEALAQQVLQFTEGFLPAPAQDMLRGYIVGEASVGLTGAGLIGLVTLVWGAFKIFRGLDKSFSEIFDTESKNSFVDQLKDSAVVLVSLAVAIVAAVAATTVFAVSRIPFIGLLSPLFLAIGLTIALFPIFYEFPDLDLSWKEVVPGVVIAAVGWTLLQILFQVYLSLTGQVSTASIIGAVLVLLTWLYFSAVVLLVGAVVNAVIVGQRATGEIYDPSESGEADGAESLEREREKLERERRALERERRERDADVDELRRANRRLRRRVRWYEKPLWARAVQRLLGLKPTDESTPNR